jgi:hypothetical protein
MLDALKISLIAFTFVALGDEGMIFNFYQRLLLRFPEWLAYPLGGCGICFSGQCATWFFIFTKPFNLFDLLVFVSLSIFTTKILSTIWHLEQ